jgi:hypothetical protein
LLNKQNEGVLSNRFIIAPAISCLFRREYLWTFRPHLQSYCFAMNNSVVRDLIRFISTVNQSQLVSKKDYIEKLELGMSRFFMEESPDTIHYCGRSDQLIKLANILGVLRSNPYCLLDPRLSGISAV